MTLSETAADTGCGTHYMPPVDSRARKAGKPQGDIAVKRMVTRTPSLKELLRKEVQALRAAQGVPGMVQFVGVDDVTEEDAVRIAMRCAVTLLLSPSYSQRHPSLLRMIKLPGLTRGGPRRLAPGCTLVDALKQHSESVLPHSAILSILRRLLQVRPGLTVPSLPLSRRLHRRAFCHRTPWLHQARSGRRGVTHGYRAQKPAPHTAQQALLGLPDLLRMPQHLTNMAWAIRRWRTPMPPACHSTI